MRVRIRIIGERPASIVEAQPSTHSEISSVKEFSPEPNGTTRVGSGNGGTGAARVALGILVSRITGLIRERAIAHYFGNSAVADAFRAAIRIPNLLNNLFGEGVLSASFVTVYAKLLAESRDEEADAVANTVFGMLALICALGVLIGIAITPFLIDVIAPGFADDKRELTIQLVRILFPSTGLLALSAWCLGILNSHRRFLLSYLAPVALNVTMIAALVTFGPYSQQADLGIYLAWAAVAGSALQLLVQVPRVLDLLGRFKPSLEIKLPQVRMVTRNFVPVFLSRGVVQLSSYIDSVIASLLPTGAVAALGYAQTISILPISLFSMSVSAAELPALSSATGTNEQIAEVLRSRLIAGLRRISFLVVPSAIAFLVLGDVVAGALYQTGRFHRADSVYVWGVLAGSSVGLLASALGRLYSSAYYALLDTRTPLKFALIRVALTTLGGLIASLYLPGLLHVDAKWGVAGLTASAGVAGWVEFYLLRRGLSRRIGFVSVPANLMVRLWIVGLLAAAAAFAIKRVLGTHHPLPLAVVALSLYGALYFAGTMAAGVEEARDFGERLLRKVLPGRGRP